MANTYCKIYIHVVFAVKNRNAVFPAVELPKIHRFIGGMVKSINPKCRAEAVGGNYNHIHMLLSLSPDISLSQMVKEIKTASNRFINESRLTSHKFEWQKGYAGISVSPGHLELVRKYIGNQMEHHHGTSMTDEVRLMLTKAGIEFEDKYIFEDILNDQA